MGKSKNLADLGSHDVIDTHSTGMTVTGTVASEGLTVDGGNMKFTNTVSNDSRIYFTHSTTANRRSYIGALETDGNGNSLIFAPNANGTDASEAMRIDSIGNLLVGTTNKANYNNSAGTTADDGLVYLDGGILSVSSHKANANVGFVQYLNRTNTDGGIVEFRKDGSTVGSIGVVSTDSDATPDLYIGGDNTGIRLGVGSDVSAVVPCLQTTGALRNGVTSLGASNARFNSLYLSGSTQSKNDYSYSVLVSNTTNPTLKNADGSTWGNSEAGIVMLYISGTGTPDTDQVFMLGSNGSSTHQVRGISTNSPNVSNRPNLSINSSGDPILTTGHSSTYTVHVRVLKVP